MRIRNSIVSVSLVFVCAVCAYSQEIRRAEVGVDFRVNRVVLDTTYLNNAERLQQVVEFVNFLQSEQPYLLQEVSFRGAASPEGSYQLNVSLASRRMRALERFIRSKVSIPDSIVKYDDTYIRWDYLKREVSRSDLPNKEDILRILNEEGHLVSYFRGNQVDDRIVKLKQLDNGQTWNELHRRYFQAMREAYVVFELRRQVIHSLQAETAPVQQQSAAQSQLLRRSTPTSPSALDAYAASWHPKWYINTNALALSMGITSLGAEYAFAKHWSVAVPLMYSGWNYFTETIKFRTLAVQPELRYWFDQDHKNWFIGAHGAVAYYNVAVDGALRYQDKDGERPAYGGGLSFGYRLPFKKNTRWSIDFAIGAGVYSLQYDAFHNVENGKFISTHAKTYIGVDNASITLNYQLTPNRPRR